MTFREQDRTPGSGVLLNLSDGLTLSLLDVCTLMICMSDNSATNMIIDILGVEPVNECMRSLGCIGTELNRKVYSNDTPRNPANAKYGLGVTNVADQLHLLNLVQSNFIGDVQTCDIIRTMLGKQHYRTGIPRLMGEDYKFMGKSGSVDHVRNDVGIVITAAGRSILLAIFCQDIETVSWSPDNIGLLAIANLSKSIVDYLDSHF